jgi:secreted PhoX family phosphatase
MVSRRMFNQGLVALAFTGLSRHIFAGEAGLVSQLLSKTLGYGTLVSDPEGMLDLPAGFSYHAISSLGETMSDGLAVPDRADGMGCFPLDKDRVVLVRNHELSPSNITQDALSNVDKINLDFAYDINSQQHALPGGTSNLIYNLKTQRLERQFMSLIGTIRNCSGGITPWNSWLTCEESVLKASDEIGQDHGYVFEVPADASALIKARPIIGMGRFNHEAACVDPNTNIIYLTEDRHDSLFYRFIPKTPQNLHAGGRLQALAVMQEAKFDSRNWDITTMQMGKSYAAKWIDLTNVESPEDDLRQQGYAKGAALFARGEGIHWATNELYFCCTNGGTKKVGQIMKYIPSKFEGKQEEANYPGKLSLFVESPDKLTFNYGDNICVAPNHHLIVCEDQYTDAVNNHLKGITPDGHIYDFARIRWQTEPAGACFSPDGSVLFVNLYSPTRTLAITGPWENFRA